MELQDDLPWLAIVGTGLLVVGAATSLQVVWLLGVLVGVIVERRVHPLDRRIRTGSGGGVEGPV
jgi:hypothetical protein